MNHWSENPKTLDVEVANLKQQKKKHKRHKE